MHPGFNSKFDLSYDQDLPDKLLYPAEYLSVLVTSEGAECISDHPCLCGRLCALPLALCDTLCVLPVLLFDLVWSIIGSILFTIARVFTCCSDDAVPCGDCWVAVASNLGKLFCNVCFGPILCAITSYTACKLGSIKTFLIGCLYFPCVYPVSFLLSLWSLCVSPKDSADDMTKQLKEVYNV